MPYKFNPLPPRFDRVEGGTPAPDVETLTGDTGGAVGPDASFNIDILGNPDIEVAGNPGTNTLQLTNLTKITPYVVCATDGAYTTIQAAINAANAAGGGVVYICPDTYSEDLTLFAGVDLYGTPAVSQNQGASVSIIGTHTPPDSGKVGFNSIYFQSTTDVFSSAAAGSTHLAFLNCESAVQNGYFLNLPNWTGILEIFDYNPDSAGAPFAVDDGGINNTGGATVLIFEAGFSSGSSNTMVVSGTTIIDGGNIFAPVDFQTGSSFTVDNTVFGQNVQFSDNSTGEIAHSRFTTSASSAATMNSSGDVSLSQCIFDSSNTNVIDGSGSGALTLKENTFLDSEQIGESVNTPNLVHTITGQTTTNGPLSTDVLTYTLRDVAASYQIVCQVNAIGDGNEVAGGQITGLVKTDGASASIVASDDSNFDMESSLPNVAVNIIPNLNTFEVQVSGEIGVNIKWNIVAKMLLINN